MIKKILVIGAGPSGLVAAKTLSEHGYDVNVAEVNDQVGGTFRTKSYDDGHLVSSKYITAFSDFRLPKSARDHPTIPEYLEYLEKYAKHFDILRKIFFETRVENVERCFRENGEKYYKVFLRRTKSKEDRVEEYDAVCICSGLHNVPHIPNLEGLNKFKGTVLHSSKYKKKEVFKNKRVLIVGCGETGLDIAYRAIQVTENVVLAVRSGFLSTPYVINNGIPLDTFITNLFECSHQHPLVEKYHIKQKFTTPFIRGAFLLGTGTSKGYNQWAGAKETVRRGYHIINKSTDAMPYINRGPKSKSFLGRNLYRFLDECPQHDEKLKNRQIDVKRNILRILDGSKVEFRDGSIREFDCIVLATGYRVSFPFLSDSVKFDASISDSSPMHDTSIEDMKQDGLPAEHNIVDPSDINISYIGFVRPNVGAIPPMSELQVLWWIQRLRGVIPGPKSAPSYKLLGTACRTGAYGVDYGAYMHDLARDIDADPSILELLFKSPKSLIAWAMGQAYITFFRLRGPFATLTSVEIAETELLRPVVGRPLVSNLAFVAIFVIFCFVNVLATLFTVSLDVSAQVYESIFALYPALRIYRQEKEDPLRQFMSK